MVLENPSDFKKECASGVVKSPSFSSDTKCLARKSRTKEVVVGDFVCSNGSNVSCIDFGFEVFFIYLCCIFIPLVDIKTSKLSIGTPEIVLLCFCSTIVQSRSSLRLTCNRFASYSLRTFFPYSFRFLFKSPFNSKSESSNSSEKVDIFHSNFLLTSSPRTICWSPRFTVFHS